jgi:hypothetical protein
VPVALSTILLRVKAQSLSNRVDAPSIDLSYYAPTFPGLVALDVAELATAVATSLTTTAAGAAHSLSYYWNYVISRATNSATVTAYDVSAHLDGTPHGSPLFIKAFTPTTGAAPDPLPEGLCVVLTLQAAYDTDVEFVGNTRPRARDRGRIYFGPIGAANIVNDANQAALVRPALQTDMRQWAKAASRITTPTNSITWDLSVWSRKNAAMKPVVEVWTDDRFDYQRRRANQPGTRAFTNVP